MVMLKICICENISKGYSMVIPNTLKLFDVNFCYRFKLW